MTIYMITEEHFAQARDSFGSDKEPNRIFGKAAELRVKDEIGEDIRFLEDYAPWDFILNGEYCDVKTRCLQADGTLAASFSIGKTEVIAWPKALKEGRDTVILLCEQTGEVTFRLVGYVTYSGLVKDGKIKDSFKKPGTQYFYA